MRWIFLIVVLLTTTIANAQKNAEAYDQVLTKMQLAYNKGDYSQIYTMFDQDMKSVLSLNNAKTFFAGIRTAFGDLQSVEFIRENPPFYQYKGVFADGDLSIDLSVNKDNLINGLQMLPMDQGAGAKEDFTRNSTPLSFVAAADWYVFYGGNTEEQNYHVTNRAQRHAIDLVVRDEEGSSKRNVGNSNESYYAFGKKVFAPAAGEIVFAVDGIPDNTPGSMNPAYAPGNSVLLKLAEEEYLLLAHFKQGTVAVEAGDTVKQGELLGQCGNSGNSSEPHIHMHMQDSPSLSDGTGIEMYFTTLLVNGKTESAYAPVKGQTIARP